MFNRALMSRWQNWLTVFLMISLVTVGAHSLVILFDND